MTQSHSKYIQTPNSSTGKDTSSNSGSQSSKTSKDSNKPIRVATAVGKDIISSNPNFGDDEDEPSEEDDNNSDKRKKIMNKNYVDGSST